MTDNYPKSKFEIVFSNLKWPIIFVMFFIFLIFFGDEIKDLFPRLKKISREGAEFEPAKEVKVFAQKYQESIPEDTAGLSKQIWTSESEKAIKTYGELKNKNLGLDVYKVMAFSYLKQGRFEEAISELKKVLSVTTQSSDSSWALYNWGVALSQLNKHDEAIEKYRKAVKLTPNSADPYISWGLALEKLGRYEEAIAKYQKAAEINPNFGNTYLYWGLALEKLGRYKEAIGKYQNIVQIYPNDANGYYTLAGAQSRLGNKVEAVRNLKKAIELNKIFKENAKADKDFDNLRNDPEFKKLVGE